MPVKRRKAKRLHTASIESWELYLECGRDYFDDLVEAGVVENHGDQPSEDQAYAAWLAYAEELLERWSTTRHADQGQAWALEMFGDPRAKRGRRRR